MKITAPNRKYVKIKIKYVRANTVCMHVCEHEKNMPKTKTKNKERSYHGPNTCACLQVIYIVTYIVYQS